MGQMQFPSLKKFFVFSARCQMRSAKVHSMLNVDVVKVLSLGLKLIPLHRDRLLNRADNFADTLCHVITQLSIAWLSDVSMQIKLCCAI